jgi:hypothetical protein
MLLEKQEREKQLSASKDRGEPRMTPEPTARFRIHRKKQEEDQEEYPGADE